MAKEVIRYTKKVINFELTETSIKLSKNLTKGTIEIYLED